MSTTLETIEAGDLSEVAKDIARRSVDKIVTVGPLCDDGPEADRRLCCFVCLKQALSGFKSARIDLSSGGRMQLILFLSSMLNVVVVANDHHQHAIWANRIWPCPETAKLLATIKRTMD